MKGRLWRLREHMALLPSSLSEFSHKTAVHVCFCSRPLLFLKAFEEQAECARVSRAGLRRPPPCARARHPPPCARARHPPPCARAPFAPTIMRARAPVAPTTMRVCALCTHYRSRARAHGSRYRARACAVGTHRVARPASPWHPLPCSQQPLPRANLAPTALHLLPCA